MKVVRRGFLATVTLFWALALPLASQEAYGEERHGSDTPPAPADSSRPPGDTFPATIYTLRRALKERAPGSAAYWTAAHGLLNALGTDTKKIDDIEGELADRRKSLFQELRKARGNLKNEELQKLAQGAAGDARDASRAEIDRRITDPNVQFLINERIGRPETALRIATELLAAIQAKDDKKAGEILAKMMGTLNKSQVETLAKHTEGALKVPEKLKEKGLNETFIRNLFETAAARLGRSVPKSDTVDAFAAKMPEVDERNKKFHEKVARVVRGGEDGKKARDELLREYDPALVADFVSSQLANGGDGLAVDTARAFAREDKDGNLFLDLEASNFAFGDKDRNQSLLLGKKNELEQIRASLAAFQTGEQGGHDGELISEFNGAKTDRLQRFRFAATPNESAARTFAGVGEGGKPSLRRSETPIPTEKLATLRISNANKLPSPPPDPPPSVTPTVTPTPTGGTPTGRLAAVKAALESGTCKKCHSNPDPKYSLLILQGDSVANARLKGVSLREALLKASVNNEMRPAIRDEIKALLAKL